MDICTKERPLINDGSKAEQHPDLALINGDGLGWRIIGLPYYTSDSVPEKLRAYYKCPNCNCVVATETAFEEKKLELHPPELYRDLAKGN